MCESICVKESKEQSLLPFITFPSLISLPDHLLAQVQPQLAQLRLGVAKLASRWAVCHHYYQP